MSDADEIGYGGAAGGGKSESLLREVLRQVHIPGYTAILFRRTYPELELSLIKRAREIYPRHGLISKNGGKLWVMPHAGGDASIIFGHLEYDADVHKYQSAEFDVIGFDEATSFTEAQYNYMRSRVRGTDKNIKRYTMAATNPGNIGHAWFKSRFISNKEPYTKYYYKKIDDVEVQCDEHDPDAMSRVFIPASVYDNPTLLENDPKYLARLKSLNEVDRKMLLNGDWDVFKGQYFSEWNPSRHVIKPFKIPSHWPVYGGLDYGSTAPFAAYLVAFNERGDAYVIREYYASGRTARENGQAVYKTLNDEYKYIFADPSIFGSKNDNGETNAQIISTPFKEDKTKRVRLVPASNRRIDGWQILRDYLSDRSDTVEVIDGVEVTHPKPNIYVFSNCVNLIRTIPMMIYDKFNPEDLDTTLEDHALDALRYVLQSLKVKRSKEKQEEERVPERFRKKRHSFNPNTRYIPR